MKNWKLLLAVLIPATWLFLPVAFPTILLAVLAGLIAGERAGYWCLREKKKKSAVDSRSTMHA